MIEKYISHPDDKNQAKELLEGIRYPSLMILDTMPPKKEHNDEYDKKRRLQAYLFRTIIPTLSKHAGVDYAESEGLLRTRYLKAEEIIINSTGEYDIMWVDNENFHSFSEGKKYKTQSIGDLSVSELIEFIDNCKNYILRMYGVNCPTYQREFKTKEI